MLLKRLIVSSVAVAALGSGAVVAATSAAADPGVAGTYNATTGLRIVDTRSGVGLAHARVGAGRTVTFSVASKLGANGDLAPLNLGITVVAPTSSGFLTAFQGGSARPAVSTLNFAAGRNLSNTAVVKSSATGTVSVYNQSPGSLDLLVDLNGYWTAGTVDPSTDGTAGALNTVTPTRLLDTRKSGGAIADRGLRSVAVAGKDGIPTHNVSAVLLNVTAADPTKAGYLSVSADPEASDARTSVVNFAPKTIRADLVSTQLNTDGNISIYNGSYAPVDATVDVVGYITDGTPQLTGAFVASTPYRAQDTRTAAPVAANGTDKVQIFPNDGSAAIFQTVAVTVTVANAKGPGFLVAWNGKSALPPTSSMNHLPNDIVGQLLYVPVNPDGSISIHNHSSGTVDLVVDVRGFTLNFEQNQNASASRIKSAMSAARHFSAQHVNR